MFIRTNMECSWWWLVKYIYLSCKVYNLLYFTFHTPIFLFFLLCHIIIARRIRKGDFDMAKACIRINKIKSIGTMTSRYNHDYRVAKVDNANPDLITENDFLIPIQDENGESMTYKTGFQKRMKEVEAYQTKKVRKDAVLGFDVLIEFGDKDDIDGISIEDWETQTVKWLQDTFNVAGDGKDNVLSVVCHKDESSPHIHAFVIPIDEENHLNAKRFTGGYSAMSEMQSSYYEYVKDLGIERGVPKSSAHHKDIRKFYGELQQEIEIPMPNDGETALDFRTRCLEDIQTKNAAAKRERDKKAREQQSRLDKERNSRQLELTKLNEELQNIQEQIKKTKEDAEQNKISNKSEIKEQKEEIKSLKAEIDKLNDEFYKLSLDRELAESLDKQIKAIEHMENIDVDRAKALSKELDQVIQIYEDYLWQNKETELNSDR